jgi:signal transduction histidine kinase
VFAQVNALAARRARETASYDAGAGYAERGLAFLGSDAWNTHHAIALSLYEEGAEAAYARREFARCETMISEATGHARTDIEAVRVTDIQLRSLMAQQRLGEAVRAGGALLRRLGISVPQKPNMGHIAWQLIRTLLTLRGRGALKLSRLADMNDPRALAALQIAMTLTAITFFAAPDLLPVIGLQVVRLSARRGNSPLSAFSYTIYGMVLGLLGNTRGAYDFGRLGMEVLERYGARETRAKIHTAYYALIHHRRHPLRDCLEPLMAAYRHGMADGDTEFAALALVNHVGYQLFSGVALEEVDRTARWACSVVRDLSQLRHLTDLRITHQCTLNLMGRATDPRLLEGEAFSESAEAARLDNAQDRESLLALWALRGMARYVLGDPAGALERAEDVEAHLWKRGEIGAYPVEHFLYALFYLAAARDRPERRARYVRLSQRHQKAIQVWGRDAPMNHRHKWDLIEAERLSVLGRDVEPLTLYEAAIAGARENGYLQEEAIALELASRHHRDRGRPGVASAYLRDAHHAYVRWGATAKVRQLEQGHPALLSVPQPASGGQVTVTGRTVQVADLGLILEALQTIAGEILIDHLLDRLMRILLQGAGADEGYLLLDEDGELVLKALGSVRGGVVSVSLISRSMSADDPPSALVRYVARTGVPLVVSDVNTDELFHADTCLRGGGVRSVLCVPVAHRGIRKGIICLTNSLVAGAFRQDRAELIGLLASQAAVSLENAGLYARLLEDIEARKRVERELRESEETARGLLNALGEPAFLVDGRGRLFERNAAFAGRFAPPPTGPKGTAWSVMGPIGAVAAELVADAMRTGQARRRETPVGSRWTDVVAYPVTHLEIPKSAVVLFDVTERKETQRQLEIEREELQRADKLATIGVLVTSVAHEVTSPNQAVRLAGDVLARVLPDLLRAVDEYVQDDSLLVGGLALPELRRRCADALSAVHDGSAHIAAIVAELTAYGARERELPTDRADINEAVLAAARLLDTHIRQFTDRFRLDLADELPMVDGNTSKVEQVVVNLIENACHALTGRGAAIVVSTRYDSPTGEVRIIVQDEGRGIEPDLIARITDPFFTTRRDAGGTGLGLSISERIVARYGGSLRFESVVGRGTAATAAIPVPRPR